MNRDKYINDNINNLDKNFNFDLLEIHDDGTIQINGNYSNIQTLNFAFMTITSLLFNQNSQLNENFDMKFIKEKNDISEFKIIYSNCLTSGDCKEKDLLSNIKKLTSSFKNNVNYLRNLGQVSPALKEVMSIIYKYVLNKKGAFQMHITYFENNYNIELQMDEKYSDILEALSINGAYVMYDTNGNGIATVNETIPGNQLFILNGTNEMLDPKLENDVEFQYIKEIKSYQNANANFTILIIICMIEIMLLGVYFIFLFNK